MQREKKAFWYTVNKKYNRSLFKVFCIRGCTRRLYHIGVRPKTFAKRDADKSEVYSESELAQKKNQGKNQDGGTLQKKVKKHGKQELTQENTARYWTHTELELKCSRNFFQCSKFAH